MLVLIKILSTNHQLDNQDKSNQVKKDSVLEAILEVFVAKKCVTKIISMALEDH